MSNRLLPVQLPEAVVMLKPHHFLQNPAIPADRMLQSADETCPRSRLPDDREFENIFPLSSGEYFQPIIAPDTRLPFV